MVGVVVVGGWIVIGVDGIVTGEGQSNDWQRLKWWLAMVGVMVSGS